MSAEFTPRLRRLRRPCRGLAALALLAFAPKCLLCLAGWLGLGATLGLVGPEICGASSSATAVDAEAVALIAGGLLALAAGGVALCRGKS
jgi:hypothetical protein